MALQISKIFGEMMRLQNKTMLQVPFLSSISGAAQLNFKQQSQSGTSDTDKEVQHHSNYAQDWWNTSGPMRGLHALNEIRVPFIRDGLIARSNIENNLINTTRVLQKQNILEVGCGGGILTEKLGRLGANVTGLDLSEDLIKTAREHLKGESPELQKQITYKLEPVEVHVKDHSNHYDAVIVSEVLEHVSDKVALLNACTQALKPGASIFITTINKTIPMWLGGVLAAEYVFRIVPQNTHHWDKMISPLDVQRILDTMNCQTVLVNGSTYDFWRNRWRWINSTSMCYALQAIKTEA